MSIKKMIENPHNTYKKYRSEWDFLAESYEGGKDYIGDAIVDSHSISAGGEQLKLISSSHLFRHKKERTDDYKNRVKMSYYYNFCAPIVDIYTNHLFKNPIIEDWGNIKKIIEYRKENVDRMDSSIYEFRKEISDLAQIYGQMYVITDVPSQSGRTIMTAQDEIDNDMFPYFTAFHPQDVINWALDSFGKPYWVLVQETHDSNENPFTYDESTKPNIRYRLWTRTEWILVDGEGGEIARGTHGLGMVPITCFTNKKSKKMRNFLGISALADIAYISRDIYNSCSELKQILRDQTFAILTLQGSTGEYSEVSVGTSKALLYPPERTAPAYISPAPSNAEMQFKHIDRQVSAIFRLAKLEGASAEFKGQSATQESGVAKAYDFNETNQALSDKADNLQDGEMKMWRTFGAWKGIDFDGSVIYPKEFSIQSLNADLDEAEKSIKLNIGNMFNVEIKKAIIKKKFPRIPETMINKMVKELEDTEGKTEGSRLVDRILNKEKSAVTPTQAENKEG